MTPRAVVLLSLAALLGAGAQDEPAAPTWRALLVGCTEYPFLRERFPERYEAELRLLGPANDVALMRRVLVERFGLPEANVVELSGWGEDPATRPTLSNLRRALSELERAAGPGDQVVLFFAGHGSQQQDAVGDEPDGLDEVFLPADVRPSRDGRIPGALTDDELGSAARRVRAKGAAVWMVFDCCHAGTMARGGSERTRGLDAAEFFGVQSGARGSLEREHGAQVLGGGQLDGIAALYAAESYARAPEMELPEGGGEDHGLFTWLLARELVRAEDDLTFRGLCERLVRAYQAHPGAGTVPMAEGDLDRALAGGAGAPASAELAELFAAERDVRLRVALPAGAQDLLEALARHPERFAPVAAEAPADCRVFVGASGQGYALACDGPTPALLGLGLQALLERLAALQVASALARAEVERWTAPLTPSLELVFERRRGGQGPIERVTNGDELAPGDRVRLVLVKHDDALVDAYVYWIDAALGLTELFPGDRSPRLERDARGPLELTPWLTITDDALGLERLIVLALPREEGEAVVDLAGLATLARARGGGGELLALLDGGSGGARGGAAAPSLPLVGTLALRTAWPRLGPPPWPRLGVKTLAPPLAPSAREGSGGDGGDPEPWALRGDRAALGRGLLLVGDAAGPRDVLFDLDGSGLPRPEGLAAALEQGALDVEAIFRFEDDRWTAFYDSDGDGQLDLALVDLDRDGVAEVRSQLTEAGWRRTAPVALPWLSQGHLALPALRGGKAAVTERFRALVR